MAKVKKLSMGLTRVAYMAGNFISYYIPDAVYSAFMRLRFCLIAKSKKAQAQERIRRYVCLPKDARLDDAAAVSVGSYRYPFGQKERHTTYFFDLYRSIRMMDKHLRFSYIFGDVYYDIPYPAFVKTRPIHPDGMPSNSVICKLNRIRHYNFVHDRTPWRQKKDMLVMRNVIDKQPRRLDFINATIDSPMCDVGQVNPNPLNPEYQKPYMTMAQMMEYKFVACLEGNDVATNLKWVMSSNSIAVMPRPRIESWFLESRLEPGVHYIEIKDDFSDLEEQMRYYIAHPEEAERIIAAAHSYVKQFRDATLEKWIQYQVTREYFSRLNQ